CGAETLEDAAMRYGQQIAPGDPFHAAWEDLLAGAEARGMTLVTVDSPEADPAVSEEAVARSLDAYRPVGATLPEAAVAEAQRREFFHQMHRWLRQGWTVHAFCNNAGERERFGELWQEYALGAPLPARHLGSLSRGFLLPEARAGVVTDGEIYGRYKVSRSRRLKSPHAQAMRSAFEVDFSEFEEGDYVVHLQHGIGIFRGLAILPPARPRSRDGDSEAAGSESGQECLTLEYAPREPGEEPPKLYVPVSEAHLVSRYVGAGKARPALSTLGGARWTRAKEQAEAAVRDLASDLLNVQAARATQPGMALAADTHWQQEFEAAFEYEETPDQLTAIAAVKSDQESARPMDRLLCGDVGFGKTEVAVRAAFKAVMSGKQAAVLVPTTVLAQQHFNQFRERMASYPVRIELLSRFRTARQQKAALEAAAAGMADILIGTHRMLSPDVSFKDLGLVVVDEEQKFGVRHKERLKRLRTTVDVLTLSATPIPRTLYLALTGARDLSTLETPPQDRLPVETIVGNYDERVIRDAIRRELQRGGQVYFLHNRVATIEAVALKLSALVPEGRFVVGHGQMDADDLERVMTRFVAGEADVLVSTTIIESGLDIPNANTMIIDRADRFGLSELYQLRGRVGRYKHQAYCYLMLPRHAQLLTEARKRMSAIKQYSALGSGFKIAMRDLEIRGAGNLLGPQQSGHITAVGFDLYCQLLKQSIASLKGERSARRSEVRMRLDFLAMNPGEETAAQRAAEPKTRRPATRTDIEVPREGVATYVADEFSATHAMEEEPAASEPRAPAYLPHDYLREPAQRLEIYRKLAQAIQASELEAVVRELRDRFGPPPPAVELLLGVHALRLLAASRGITSVEVAGGKVKLTRNRDLITVGGQFPRLSRREARARLNELRKLIESLAPERSGGPPPLSTGGTSNPPRPPSDPRRRPGSGSG
ncbi:MAG: transcription-repair coupling factor, partial [Verrucomicrobiae bacterium]|nr:transcription-repair coupling factor [Verrucomicrobiae bacterium]